jgi:aspartate/methionine/tyrosine aminotransferase
MPDTHFEALRSTARAAPESGIVEIANYSWGRPGLIPLWAGEGDLPTPQFICDAAAKSMADGETFYTWQRGIPELREALAAYHTRQFGRPFSAERFFVTGSGMQAIQIAVACIAGPGDEVVLPTPAWPNMAAALEVAGAKAVCVPLGLDVGRWSLDLDRLFAAVTPATRGIFINSPANPTGWTAGEDELRTILNFARERGLWIVSDEVYSRFVYDRDRAPSFYDVMDDEDLILFVNTFSKNWSMTGWRVGWISAPPEIGQVIENLIQYSTSGVAAFMQRAAVTALNEGEDFVAAQVARAAQSRKIICDALAGSNRVQFAVPDGAFYLLFSVDGEPDTRKLAKRLVDEAGIVMAPGTAFGPGAEPYLRICFARKPEDMAEAARRLSGWLAG